MPTGAGPPVNFPMVGYRIDFRVGGGVLEAIVSGRSGFASAVAREIGEQARRSSVQQVLIDIRGLHDRDLRRFEDHHAALAWLRSAQRRGRGP